MMQLGRWVVDVETMIDRRTGETLAREVDYTR